MRDRVLTPPNFTLIFSDMPGVLAYQIRQETLDELDILVVRGLDFSNDVERYVMSSLRALVGDGVQVTLHYVTDIPIPESGKRRYIVSKVGRVAAR